jgi:GTP cyclohydrolase I
MECFLTSLGVDLDNVHLKDTPGRVARAFEEHFLSGYKINPEVILRTEFEEKHYDDIVLVKGIPFYSLCAHHLVPFYGVGSIAYIPDGKLTGLSKLGRVLDAYAKRLQVQERLTHEVAVCINKVLTPRGVGVVLEAEHLCMSARGLQKPGIRTVTSCMLGVFLKDPAARSELMSLIAR